MSRRISEKVVTNHDRWVVSYADFVTVLFAFFVVMYSISSVNEGKYRVLSNSVSVAFTGSPDASNSGASLRDLDEFTEAEIIQSLENLTQEEAEVEADAVAELPDDYELESEDLLADNFSEQALNRAEQEIDSIGSQVEEEMHELIAEDLIEVRRNKFWLEIEIKSNLLFPSGSSQLLDDAVPILADLSENFVGLPNRLNIEGFTDNEPIANERFPSNWELSASRAATVVRLFEERGIEPYRMASIGYGEHQPIAENTTLEGKARNRRVVIVVMASIRDESNQRVYDLDLLASD